MKKYINLFLVLLCTFCAIFALSSCKPKTHTDSQKLHYTASDDGSYYTLTECRDENITNAVIPDTINGYPVTGISDSAFENCEKLTHVTVGNNVTEIGSYAFENCTSLTDITLPTTITYIGHDAFYRCNSLKFTEYHNCLYLASNGNDHFVLLSSNYSYTSSFRIHEDTKIIGSRAFEGRIGLTTISIPNGVVSICSAAFADCEGLRSINIPYGVINIGMYAFDGCSSLTDVRIPGSVSTIGRRAFAYCSDIKRVTVDEGVKAIEDSAFSNCYSLESISVPSSLISVEEDVFYKCNNLKFNEYNGARYLGNSENEHVILYEMTDKTVSSYHIPDGTKIIYSDAFTDHEYLADVTFSESLTNIGAYAFYNCNSLKSIVIPDSVITVGQAAFSSCTGLEEITIGSAVTDMAVDAFSFCPLKKAVFKSTDGWRAVPSFHPEDEDGMYARTKKFYSEDMGKSETTASYLNKYSNNYTFVRR